MHRSEILNEVNDYVSRAVSRLERKRYAQEAAYVDAFLGRLDGTIDLGNNNGVIDLQSTVVADRGPGAAEHKFGADFALVFRSNGNALGINKAIIAQAKNGKLEKLSSNEKLASRLNAKEWPQLLNTISCSKHLLRILKFQPFAWERIKTSNGLLHKFHLVNIWSTTSFPVNMVTGEVIS